MAKRARERARAEKKAAKQARKDAAPTEAADAEEGPDEAALMEEFRVLSERHAAELISEDVYTTERERIFGALGIET